MSGNGYPDGVYGERDEEYWASQRDEKKPADEMVRVHVHQHEVDGRCTLALRKDGVTVQGPASGTAPLTVPMPQFGCVKNVYASVSDGWEFVEAWYEMTQDEVNMASEWSDYRKHYGVSSESMTAAHQAFKAGWQAARGASHEAVQR